MNIHKAGGIIVISGKTKLYGLIGNPVSHSLSPAIMNHAFEMHGIKAVYLSFQLERPCLAAALRGLAALGACGINVTFPYKEAVASLVDKASAGVDAIGAANTITFKRKESLAFNTDAIGVRTALQNFGGLSLEDKRIFIFGAGGAGRAAAYGLLEAGAGEISFCIRDLSRNAGIAANLHNLFPGRRISFINLSSDTSVIRKAIENSDIVINATPVGMEGYGATSLPLEATWLSGEITCFEFVYHPPETEFLKIARAGGAQTLGGLELLVAQASESFRLWTGEKFPLPEMLDYARNIQAEENRFRNRPAEPGEIRR